MATEHTVQKGLPDRTDLVNLLNAAYDHWGDEAFLEWKYDLFPDYDAETDNYYIEKDGSVVAFRRLHKKELIRPGKSTESRYCYIFGDTCVHPEYQGEGLFSAIKDKTVSDVESKDNAVKMAYNRKGNVTYKVHMDQGWESRKTGVYMRVLTPEKVVPNYAQLVLEDSAVQPMIKRFGTHFSLSFQDRKVLLSDLAEETESETATSFSIPIPISDERVNGAVEAASGGSIKRAAKSILFGNLASRFQNSQETNRPTGSDLEIQHHSSILPKDKKQISEFYERVLTDYDFAFRRSDEDINHMLSHPSLSRVILVRRDSELRGLAVLASRDMGDVKRMEVLDFMFEESDVKSLLFGAIEDHARKESMDMILLTTDDRPTAEWIDVGKQMLVWKECGPKIKGLQSGSLHLGFYDIL